jgi:CubicO group peptidase (beta-lactamase class C family)
VSALAALPLLLFLAHAPRPAPDALARRQVVGALGRRLDALLARFAAYGFSGTVLVAKDGRVVLLEGYGLADAERGLRNTAATRFEMNSMTKMFTGAAILQLAAQGRLRPSDTVEQRLGGFPPDKQGATIEQLAMHTSGLIVEGTDLAGESRAAFVRDVRQTPRESAPGEKYRYTNAGFSLLAAIVETASGESYEAYLRAHLFAPAGMRTAVFRDEVPAGDPSFAHGYIGTPAGLEPGPPNPYVWGTRGAGGVWSTVGDMYRWLVALEEGRILPEPQWRILTAPPRPPAQEAFGWHVETTPEGRPRIQKGGGSDDFASHLLFYPRERLVVVWATNNLRQRWRRTLNQALPALVLDGQAPVLPEVARVAPAALERLAGRYVSDGRPLQLHAAHGYLYAGQNTLQVPADVMFFAQDDRRFTAFDPSSGAVTRLQVDRGGSLSIELQGGRRISGRREAQP